MPTFSYVWEFQVVPQCQPQFEHHYGPDGPWVALFRQAPGYLGTVLMRDQRHALRYLTIDTWRNEECYRAFRAAYGAQYDAVDQLCAGFTTSEVALGEFAGPAPETSP